MKDDDKHRVLNLPELRNRMMDSDELVRQVIQTFVEDTPHRFAALKTSIESGDMREAALQSHTIKGAASTVSAEYVREAALEVEKACRTGESREMIISTFEVLVVAFEDLKALVSDIDLSLPQCELTL